MLPKTRTSGSIHVEYKRCGRQACRCAKGQLHGPYFYHHFRDEGVQRKQYVAIDDLDEAMTSLERQKYLEINIHQMDQALKELDKWLKQS